MTAGPAAAVDRAAAAPGTAVEIAIRDVRQPAQVVRLPFHRRG